MMKLLNSLLMLLILCGDIHSIYGEALQCQFQDVPFVWGSMYTCEVTSLDNSRNDMVIKSHTGTHQANKYDTDVKQIYIHDTNTKYIPAGLESLFSLTAFLVHNSQLIELRSKDFQGMPNVEYMSFNGNKLTSLASDAFSTLPKLKQIYFDSNQIKYIGSGAFDQLLTLNRVFLKGNICVNKDYEGATAITQMKEDLKLNCVEPISTTTTTTTRKNPMEVELETLKNEAKDQQKKNEIELNKLRDDLKKEQSENRKVKIERDALMSDKDALKIELKNKFTEINDKFETNCKQPIEAIGALDVKLNEIMNHLMKESKDHQTIEINNLRAELSLAKDELKMAKDQQKKESSEAKETMEQTNNDLNKELMELKSQRQLERNTYMGLRTKLMEVNEQLATCEINERSLI